MTITQAQQLQEIYDLIIEENKPQIYIPKFNYKGTYGTVTMFHINTEGYTTLTLGSISVSNGSVNVFLYKDAEGSTALSTKTYTSGSNIILDITSALSIAIRFVDSGEVYSNFTVSGISII